MGIRTDSSAFARALATELSRRTARRTWFSKDTANAIAEPLEALAYFGDGPVNLYQIRQWYEPLEALNATHPVAILTRDVRTANVIREETTLPVLWLPRTDLVERLVATNPVSAIFYVNLNMYNSRMLRFRVPAHVFLSHGESDKDYMASNQLKAYDYTFVAGDAARDRLQARLIGYDADARTIAIGRPQIDAVHTAPVTLPDDGRTTVLYAPTWEGDRPSMTYSSVLTHGAAILQALVSTGKHRVIYRPHPRTGASNDAYKRGHAALAAILAKANEADAAAGHIVDTNSTFGWHLPAADAAVVDISAVAFDWLATGKPLVLTRPANSSAHIDENGIAGSLPMLTSSDAGTVLDVLRASESEEQAADRAELIARYFGDLAPGASTQRWLAAAHRVIAERSAFL